MRLFAAAAAAASPAFSSSTRPTTRVCAGWSTRPSRRARSTHGAAHSTRSVDELLDAVAGQERFDLIAAFAVPLPVIVIAEMLGVDPADRGDFKRWSDRRRDGVQPA